MNTWKRLAIVGSAAVLFGLVQGALLTLTHHGERLYVFIYGRGPVQHATLGVACLKEHNGHTAEAVVREVGQLRTAIRRRTPEEVIVRYQHDGSSHNNGRPHPAAKAQP
jgi:hypothetical protein